MRVSRPQKPDAISFVDLGFAFRARVAFFLVACLLLLSLSSRWVFCWSSCLVLLVWSSMRCPSRRRELVVLQEDGFP